MLYGSALNLNKTGIANVICALKIDDIIAVSKNAFIKKRNYDRTSQCIKKVNADNINFIYNPKNN